MTALLLDQHWTTAADPTRGSPVVVARDVATDVRDELTHAGLNPVWVTPRIDPRLSVPLPVAPDELVTAFECGPGARAAYVVSPTFTGIRADVEALRTVARSYGARLVVDTRWSGHTGSAASARSARSARFMLARIPGVHVLSAADLALPLERIDVGRLLLDIRGRGVRADDLLPALHATGIRAEALDATRVVVTIGADTTAACVRALVLTVAGCGAWCGSGRRRGTDPLANLPAPGRTGLGPREVSARPVERVALRDAVHRICAEPIVVAPPGLPLLLPGEQLSREAVAWLLEAIACGARVQATDDTLGTVLVAGEAPYGVLDLRRRARTRR